MMDITDRKFGRLTAVKCVGQNKRYETYWSCVCDCGNTKVVNIANLRSGDTQSCGCLHKEQLAERNKSNAGENSPCWKGGVTDLNHQIRNLSQFWEWRAKVWSRDNFKCQQCGKRGGKLCAHHIEYMNNIVSKHNITSAAEAEKCAELWDISNGVTLCPKCHFVEHHQNGYKRGKYAD